jgi:nucleotide-binding universal stress UspA family protein
MVKHMLIATDGSKVASIALHNGLSLAKQLNAKVTILTVTELWSAIDLAGASEAGLTNPLKDYEEFCTRRATQVLSLAGDQAHHAGVVFDTLHIPDSKPAAAIIEAAKARGCDLIILGSHGRRGIDLLLLGSQTTKVLALSPIPVLVYKDGM